jgi:UDP-N-acetylglucosamine/UDP-N-acetylgalactosamine 4-epimerase
LFAQAFSVSYGIECVGLRYFNVFGPRQDPNGAYAAVIPRWIKNLIDGDTVWVNGDGLTSRDFCFIANTVQANLRAALTPQLPAPNLVFNVAIGQRANLLEVFELMKTALVARGVKCADAAPQHRDFRAGDVRHSLADISRIVQILGYSPTHETADGIDRTVEWHVKSIGQ